MADPCPPSDQVLALLGRIIAAPGPYLTLTIRDAGGKILRVEDEGVDEGVEAKIVVRWSDGEDEHATFTPWGAFKAGIELVEEGTEDVPRWKMRGLPRRSVKLPKEWGFTRAADAPWVAAFLLQKITPKEAKRYLVSEWSGEPVKLFAGPEGKGGIEVLIDERL
jgi:hypothetical protein